MNEIIKKIVRILPLKWKKNILKRLEAKQFEVILAVILLGISLITGFIQKLNFSEMFDTQFIISVVSLYFIAIAANYLAANIHQEIEDNLKLEFDVEKLVHRYPLSKDSFLLFSKKATKKEEKSLFFSLLNKLFLWRNKNEDENGKDKKLYFPLRYQLLNNLKKIEIIDDPQKQYMLPELAKNNYNHLMSAHKHSVVYNQVNIRMDSYKFTDGVLTINTSRTTYFDSLVTNRCMDFEIEKNITIREVLCPGPSLLPLEKSSLSNHIGFNVYIETKDGKIIFVQRGYDVSIGKGTIGSGVSASLKSMYALNSNGCFEVSGLKKAVLSEINDELNIKIKSDEFIVKNSLIAIYEDLIEGGKPQFLFYYKIEEKFENINKNFNENIKNKNKSKTRQSKMKLDGKKLLFVEKENLRNSIVATNKIRINDKEYRISANTLGTLVILDKYLEQ